MALCNPASFSCYTLFFFGYFTSLYLPLQESSCRHFPPIHLWLPFRNSKWPVYAVSAMHINGTFHNLNYDEEEEENQPPVPDDMFESLRLLSWKPK